jgi:hypothetical protein
MYLINHSWSNFLIEVSWRVRFSLIWYTDRSKTKDGTGGVYAYGTRKKLSYNL